MFRKITVCLSAAVLFASALTGCCSAKNSVLNSDHICTEQATENAGTVSDLDALVFKSGGSTIYGQILKPDRSFGENRPCVLMFHGFAGFTRWDDVGQALCRSGCVVVIPHHRGAWGSEGKYSITNCIQDAVNLTQYVKTPEFQKKYHVNPESVFLVGHSMGGNTVLNAAGQIPGICGIVMMAPCDIATMSQKMSEKEMYAFLIDNGLEVLKTDGINAVYQDILKHPGYAFPAAAKRLKKTSVLLISGQWDTCISNELLLPFYTEVQMNRDIPSATFNTYPGSHSLMGSRLAVSKDIVRFILCTMLR